MPDLCSLHLHVGASQEEPPTRYNKTSAAFPGSTCPLTQQFGSGLFREFGRIHPSPLRRLPDLQSFGCFASCVFATQQLSMVLVFSLAWGEQILRPPASIKRCGKQILKMVLFPSVGACQQLDSKHWCPSTSKSLDLPTCKPTCGETTCYPTHRATNCFVWV